MDAHAPTWNELMELLAPYHDEARKLSRGMARSHQDGDDLFHEALLRAHDKLPGLRDARAFRAWFYKILVSVHRSQHRRSFWKRYSELHDSDETAVVSGDGRRWEEERHRSARASRALATLPPLQRQAIVLFEVLGYSLEELSEIQQTSLSSAKSRLIRARKRLRKFYERSSGLFDDSSRPAALCTQGDLK